MKIPEIKQFTPVKVWWRDSYAPKVSRWMNNRDMRKHLKRKAVLCNYGAVFSIDEHFLHLCGARAIGGGHAYHKIMSIPIGCIKKVRVLR